MIKSYDMNLVGEWLNLLRPILSFQNFITLLNRFYLSYPKKLLVRYYNIFIFYFILKLKALNNVSSTIISPDRFTM